MKIYAIRDRLINYFMAPFAGPDEHEDVYAAVSVQINSGSTDAIAQAPHHFEIWTLGEVQKDGTLVPKRELLCDCASLIRPSIRSRPNRQPDNIQAQRPENESRGQPEGDAGDPATPLKATPNAP